MKNSMNCPDCMAMGGKCYAHGGEVENEKLHPEHSEPMPPRMREDLDAMGKANNQSKAAKYAKGGSVVDQIMQERKMAKGGAVEMDAEEDVLPEQRMNLEREHFMEDDEHDIDADPSEDDQTLVSEILRERKMRRRG